MRAQPIRRLLAIGLSAALALATVAPGSAQPVSTYSRSAGPPPQSQPPPSRGGRGHPRQHGVSGGDVAAIAGGAVVLCLIFCRPHQDEGQRPSASDDTPDRRDLLQNGPHVSETRPFGAYAVYGFVRRGWPIVIDYDAEPGATVSLTVAVVGRPPWVARLDGGPNRVLLPYNGPGGGDAQPALFTLESSARGDPERPSRLDILGFGCGPRAVAAAGGPGFVGLGLGPGDTAVAIDDLRFSPSTSPRVGGDFARFSYRTASLFSRVDMEILRYGSETRSGRLVITADPVARFGEQLLRPGPYGPRMWSGLDDSSRRPSRGSHRLQVRGWEVSGDESWVTALSTEEVVGP